MMLEEQSGVSRQGLLKSWLSGLDPTLNVAGISCRSKNHLGIGGLAGTAKTRKPGQRVSCRLLELNLLLEGETQG